MKSYLPIIASLFLVSTPLVLPATASKTEIVATEINAHIKNNIAREISVKISSADSSGSGVIIAQDDNTYLVLTNNHVLRDGNEFAIATHDGVTHQATFVESGIATDDDLALLEFTSDRSYQTATINTAATPEAEQTILAVGYSAETGELVTEAGKIERVPDKSLKEGYSIGYTSNVVGGMSGGAIINTDGEVIGINGKGAFPIVNTGYDLEDGTKPSAEEIEESRKLSWGLSINRLLTRVNPEIITAYSLPLPETADSIESPELTGWLGELEAKAKQITVRIDSSSGANGSGVIIAKEGNTYTVLTADHVICESEPKSRDCIDYSYDLLAPDGQKYPVAIETIKRQEGVDLATVRFTSSENYQVAELANYSLTQRDAVFVAGYPKLSQNTSAQWLFSLGEGNERELGLSQVNDNSLKNDGSSLLGNQAMSLAGGYEMVYTNITYGGMSGGAVLDSDGRVIGIHGLAEGETTFNSQSGSATQIQLGYSLGIPLNTFVGLADRLGVGRLPVQENRPKALDVKETESFQTAISATEISQDNAKPEKWLERGNQLWRLRRYEEALEAFDRTIALNPNFVHLAHYGKGLALSNDFKREAALASLKLATEIEPNFAAAFGEQSRLLDSPRRYEEALVAIEKAISLQPDNANYHYQKGLILFRLKRYEAAEVAYNKAIKISPRSTFYHHRGVSLLFQRQGKLKSALSDLNRAIEIDPNDAYAYNHRGNLYQEQGKLELALSDHNKAIEIDPNHVYAYINRGIVYQEQGKLKLALSDFNRAISTQRSVSNAAAYYNRGNIYQEQGKLELALSDYNQALDIDPNYTKVYVNRSVVYKKQGKLAKALSGYERALSINPNDVYAYYNRGILYEEQGKLAEALSSYNQALAVNPNFVEAYIHRGLVYQKQEEVDKALSDYNQALAVNPNLSEAYVNRGLVYKRQGKLDLALSDFERALEINPNLAEVYSNRGLVYKEQRRLELALSDFEQAIKINPNLSEGYNNRGLVYQEQGKIDLALSDYERAIAINPNGTSAYSGRGLVYQEQGKIDLALSDYERAIAINPNDADAHNNRGTIYQEQGKIDLALSDYERAIAIEPSMAKAYYNRGNLYNKQGKIDLALLDYERALSIEPSLAEAYGNLGFVHIKLKNLEKAKFNLEKARQLFIAQGNTQGAKQVDIGLQQLSKQERSQLAQVGESSPNSADKDSAEAQYQRGATYFQQQDFDLAIDAFTQAIKFDSEYAEAYKLRGAIYLIQEKHYLAIGDLNKVVEIDPEYAQAHKLLGIAHTNAGDIKAGISNLEKAQQLFIVQGNTQEEEETKGLLQQISQLEQSESAQASKPNVNPANESEVTADANSNESIDDNNAKAQFQSGVTYFQQQDFDSAIDGFTKAIALDSEYAEAYRLRGVIYLTQEKHDLAIEDFTKAAEISPNDAEAYRLRGTIYWMQKKYDLAIDDLNKTLEISPNDANAHQLLGMAYVFSEDMEAGISNLEKAQQLAIAQGDNKTAAEVSKFLQLVK